MPTSSYTLHALELGPMENLIYLVVDHVSQRTAVVDPAWDVPAILQKALDLQVRITDILLTHSHHDHINGVEALLAATDAQIHLTHAEAKFWGRALGKPQLHHGGESIKLGETQINVLHTPGHTPGSACFHLPEHLLCGDTLFVYGCGRCDLPGGDPEQMYSTLRRLATELPRELMTLPGHNYSVKTSCTLEEQIEGNPFLHFEHRDQFVAFRTKTHDRIRVMPMQAIRRDELENL